MTYKERLDLTKLKYPFDNWRENFFPDEDGEGGMEQYSEENCNAARSYFDKLIDELVEIGENASNEQKLSLFKIAVESLNELNDKNDGLIETGEREDLCELFDQIGIVTGLNPNDYGDGDGIASEWRDW